ncbi:MAG: DUF1579 domain-containing protein [Pirellulaceae bacterium]
MSDANSSGGGFELPRAGKEHQLLQPFSGTFRAEVSVHMGPGEPHKSTGTMVNTFQLDNLYLHQEYQGDAAPAPYPTFVGRGYWGYNFSSKMYEGFWIDNASSMMQTETGSVDAAGKVWTMLSEFQNPKDGKTILKRTVIRLIDHDHHSMESFMTGPDGGEFKTMEIQYTRA